MKLVDADNVGSFYRYVNKKLSCCSGVGCLQRPDGSLTSDSKEKAELLNNFFASVFTVDDGLCPKLSRRISPDGVGLTSISFTESRVAAKLRKLKLTTASGPDGIQAVLLKNARESLSLPLADLYDFLFNLQCVPNAWKLARVTPIFKKGKPSDVSNYRPISLTSLCCKVMESIIKDDLLYFLLSKGLISRHQHGFLSRRSTGTQLLDCLNDWTLNIERKESLDVIYIDFAKAFDSVVHNKLISKLESYGIGGSLLLWIYNFLFDRLQFVQIDGFSSSTVHVISGVPQGSVLGPILFIIYVNDVCDLIVGNSSCKLYADDIKLYSTVDFNGISCDLISTLDNICHWSHIWQLNVNVKKCNVLRIGNSCVFYDYFMSGIPVPRVEQVVDLGITINTDLKFSTYIDSCVSKAYSRSFLMFKSFTSRNPFLLTKAFSTYIRPLLEYNSYLWSPVDFGNITKIENIQRRFTKRINCMSNLSYEQRLNALGLQSLEYRRLFCDLVTMYKIVHNLFDIDRDSFIMLSDCNSTRNSTLKIFKPRVTASVRAKFICVRCINAWNFLPCSTRSANSVSNFKNKLKLCNLSSFLTVFKFQLQL